jgi:hypothetical protein
VGNGSVAAERSPQQRKGHILKVIAQDLIKPEAVEIVLPLYRELVEKTRQEEPCIAYDLFMDQKDPGHFIFSRNGLIGRLWIFTARPSISPGWFH